MTPRNGSSYRRFVRTANGWDAAFSAGTAVLEGGAERVVARRPVRSGRLLLRVTVESGARLAFSTSEDGIAYAPIGEETVAREGAWVGARLALFASPLPAAGADAFADVDWFRVETR